MRAFAIFIGLIALGLAGIAILGYPAWLVISPWLDNPKFHRISSRVGMGLLVVGFIFVARRLKIADRQSLGFGLPWEKFVVEVGKAVFFGALLMMPAVLTMIAFDLLQVANEAADGGWAHADSGRPPSPDSQSSLIEESFLRGAMLTAIKRESGAGRHRAHGAGLRGHAFLRALSRRGRPTSNAGSGIDMLTHTLGVFGQPYHILDAFLCLFAVGVLLGMVRVRTGNIAARSACTPAGWR